MAQRHYPEVGECFSESNYHHRGIGGKVTKLFFKKEKFDQKK
jgi:hypothetical protein